MPENESNNTQPKEDSLPDEWMIRPSVVYDDEYSDCRSIKSRFQQYFVDGHSTDCTQWKRDLDNSYKWEANRDIKAGKEIIVSEKIRRFERMKAHYDNDVWEKRKNPPEDWSKPLPEYMQKEYEATYLNIKSKEIKGEIEPTFDTSCTIM
ncbi:synaptic plasticity regulator PANTS [Atheta coriaria]|uniref:synaptic plasticity regulator PANTS n=1 Tax=Dalotia coriaria TaxID=877792 RepID=UPI0031F3614E